MAPAAVASVDQTVEMLEKMKLENKAKARGGSDAVKKQSNVVNGHVPPYERSITPNQPEYMDPSMYYPVNSQPFYYGGYEAPDWSEYMQLYNPGVEAPAGVYGENVQLIYPNGYGYAPYPYSPSTSPSPTMDGAQQYQYPATYFPTLSGNGASCTPNLNPAKQGDIREVAADQKQTNPAAKGPTENGRTSVAGYQDTGFGYDTSRVPIWADAQLSNYALRPSAASGNGNAASRNRILQPQNHLLSRPVTGGVNSNFMNRIFSSSARSGYGYMPSGYDSRINGWGWMPMDPKFRARGRGNGLYGYGNDNADGLNELTRGPRAKKNIKGLTPTTKDQNESAKEAVAEDKLASSPLLEQYNSPDFSVDYPDAKFFVIKSYSEDDVHKSVKYNVWASTPNGNKKLDAAYQQAQEKSGSCPVFLFFSVNASGQFVGLAEMVSSVDFDKSLEYWQQDKWNGCFSLKWHFVKDVPNTLFKHIILENNENKPVTNSRDTQEVKLEQGLQMLKIFKDHSSRTSILDDFTFYETRQKAIQEKKVRLQFQKQVWEGKSVDLKNLDASKDEFPVLSTSKATKINLKGDGPV